MRVALDFGTLYGAQEFVAHSDVLIGYTPDGFYYYETVCIPPADCQPGERELGARGMFASDEVLLDAVRAPSKPLKYPWRYALAVFEPGPTATDLGPVWAQNSQALLGGNPYGPQTGADAIEALAARIERQGERFDVAAISDGIETAIVTRQSNAAYLEEAFSEDDDIARAVDHFEQAAVAYEAVGALIAGDLREEGVGQIVAHLRDAATAERQAGEILRARAR